jgi:O-antigen ligase
MVGTFFWWNPYAIYLLAPAIFGLALAVGGRRPWRAIGWLTTPFAVSGVALSTSRASLACLAAAWVSVGLGLLWQAPRRPSAGIRLAVITAASIGMPYVLTSGLVFRIGVSPLGATQARGAGDSVSTNGSYRLDFWREAFTAFLHHPTTGTGYGRLLAETKPGTFPSSPLAHNGFLQALGEGGLLLAVPTALAVLVSVWLLLGSLRHPSTWSGVPAIAGVAGLGLLVHALVDFDWTFSADVGALAVCVALAAAPRWHNRGSSPAGSMSRTAMGLALVLAGLTLVSGVLAIGQHFEIIHSDARPQPGATS